MWADARVLVSRWLESGSLGGPLAAALGRVYGGQVRAAMARELPVAGRAPVITVSGATLGGSGKTRVAMQCAHVLARAGVSVAFVGHGYRARPGRPRVVSPTDPLAEVGDEALAAARRFARDGLGGRVRVVVAPSRDAALELAASGGHGAIVVDGASSTRPRAPGLSILAVDRARPWGAGRVFPGGDLRAPVRSLVTAADYVVEVDASPSATQLAPLRGIRFGLFTATARPGRLVRALEEHGLFPVVHLAAPDHGPVPSRLLRALAASEGGAEVDRWVVTPKCALWVERALPSARLLVLEDAAPLPGHIVERLVALAELSPLRPPIPLKPPLSVATAGRKT